MADLDLIGIIGDKADGLDAKSVMESLAALEGQPEITILINSPGGFVTEGLAIYDAIRSHPARVIIEISALAASMAAVVAMAGDTIRMSENALMMIHNPGNMIFGTADEFRKQADTLDKMAAITVAIFAKRTGQSDKRISAMLAAETWLDADEALAHGFIDEITDPASATAFTSLDLQYLKNAPAAFAQMCSGQRKETKMATKKEKKEHTPKGKDVLEYVERLVVGEIIPTAMGFEILKASLTFDQAVDAVLEYKVATGAPPINGAIPVDDTLGGSRVRVGRSYDDPAFRNNAIAEAMACRYTGKDPSDEARQFMGYTIADVAALCMDKQRLGRNPWTTIKAAITHSTSDFPLILEDVSNRFLMARYETAQSPLKALGRQVNINDFRPRNVYQFGDNPDLLAVSETGEIKDGTIGESKESWSLAAYARIFNISRKALINDDLSAFDNVIGEFGASAARLEAQILVDTLYGSAGVGPSMNDSKALFHADHNNKASSGAAPSVTTLGNGRKAMRLQTNNSSNPINVAPRTLLVPAELETSSEQLLTELQAATVSDVNPFPGRLDLAVESRLDAKSITGWYLFSAPETSGLEYGQLEGEPGPRTTVRDGWRQQGMEFKAEHDFGAGFVDFRGTYRNAGA